MRKQYAQPIPTLEADFDRAYGRDMFEKVNVIDMLEAAGAEIVPTLYAHALPGGAVAREDYLRLANGIVDALPASGLDGVWLYLHGAMQVQGIGSGEEIPAAPRARENWLRYSDRRGDGLPRQ